MWKTILFSKIHSKLTQNYIKMFKLYKIMFCIVCRVKYSTRKVHISHSSGWICQTFRFRTKEEKIILHFLSNVTGFWDRKAEFTSVISWAASLSVIWRRWHFFSGNYWERVKLYLQFVSKSGWNTSLDQAATEQLTCRGVSSTGSKVVLYV